MSPDTAELAHDETQATDSPPRRHDADAVTHVRASDIEPYIGLRYLSKLFRFMAIILVLLLLAEMITGILKQGRASIPTLLGEVSRLIVLAAVDRVESAHPGLIGGAGVYPAESGHGPFIHIDVRGYRARWIGTGE